MDMLKRLLIIVLIIIMGVAAAVRYPVEKYIEDGSCWCCKCGWQSCATCALNAKKCCDKTMSFQRWNFGKGSDANVGMIDRVNSEEGRGGSEGRRGSEGRGNTEAEQRQALLRALEKAGIQPQTLTTEQIALMLKENDLGVTC